MSAAAKILGLLIALVAMAVGGKTPAQALEAIKAQAGDYWPHLLPLLQVDGFDRAADMLPAVADHRTWFAALAAELSGNGKTKNGRAATATPKPAAAPKPADRKARSAAGRQSRSQGNA